MKICTICKIEKEENQFNWKNKLKNIKHSMCSECKKIIDKRAYANNSTGRSDRIRKNAIKQIEKAKEFIINFKKENHYSKCKENRWYVLDFHHLRDKFKNISIMVKQGCSIKKLQEEMDKCILLCSNCHREVHYLNGDEANLVEASD